MKTQTLYRAAMLALVLCFARLSASADPMRTLMTVRVPFDFYVGGTQLPADEYVISRDTKLPNVLLIQCSKRKLSVVVFTMPYDLTKPSGEADVKFNEYGGKRFLLEVVDPSYGQAYSVIRSKEERQLVRAEKK
jgi:hypothetical protein